MDSIIKLVRNQGNLLRASVYLIGSHERAWDSSHKTGSANTGSPSQNPTKDTTNIFYFTKSKRVGSITNFWKIN